jgi:hypothetical protein
VIALLLVLLPAALLFALLALGCYPGEQLLEPGVPVPWSLRVRFVPASRALRRAPLVVLPRGGTLVAHALAGRGPPRV